MTNNLSNLEEQVNNLQNILCEHSTLYSTNPAQPIINNFSQKVISITNLIQQEKRLPFIASYSNIVMAQIKNFPNNIFWDFEYFLYQYALKIKKNDKYLDFIAHYEIKIIRLLQLFGQESNIKFKYLHDFTYGFDWSKWVQDAPEQRSAVQPFDEVFLDYLYKRGLELLELIKANDKKYGKLQDGKTYRNPFSFSRSTANEKKLFEQLAKDNMLPIKLWDIAAQPIWDKAYYQYRKSISNGL